MFRDSFTAAPLQTKGKVQRNKEDSDRAEMIAKAHGPILHQRLDIFPDTRKRRSKTNDSSSTISALWCACLGLIKGHHHASPECMQGVSTKQLI